MRQTMRSKRLQLLFAFLAAAPFAPAAPLPAGSAPADSAIAAGRSAEPEPLLALRGDRRGENLSLEVRGPGDRAVLLFGERLAADAVLGTRVFAERLVAVPLNAAGRGSLKLPRRPTSPLWVQARFWGSGLPAPRWSAPLRILDEEQARLELQLGKAIITEFLKDPTAVSDAHGEWIEIENRRPGRINLSGWTLSDGGNDLFRIQAGGAPIYVAPGAKFVFGRDGDPTTNGGVAVDWVISGFTLSNGADEIYLHTRQGFLVDAIEYDDGVQWPDEPGRAIQLDPAVTDADGNDDPLRWCAASSPFGAGDAGTPGAPNDGCP